MCFFILLIYICFSCLSSKKVLKSLNGIQNQLWVTSEVRTRTNGKYHKEPILTTWVTKQWSDLPGQVVISHSWKYASARGPEVMCEHIHTHTHKHIHTRTHTCTHTNTHTQTHTLTLSWFSWLGKVSSSAVSVLIYLVKFDPSLICVALFSKFSL